jgi:hypothetical protein
MRLGKGWGGLVNKPWYGVGGGTKSNHGMVQGGTKSKTNHSMAYSPFWVEHGVGAVVPAMQNDPAGQGTKAEADVTDPPSADLSSQTLNTHPIGLVESGSTGACGNAGGRDRRHCAHRARERGPAGTVGVGGARAAEAVAGVECGDVGGQELGGDEVDLVEVGVLIEEQDGDGPLGPSLQTPCLLKTCWPSQ